MKFRITAIGAGALGLGALIIRIAEYTATLDSEGYYLLTPPASILKWMLMVVLAAGVLLGIFVPFATRKEQADLGKLFRTDPLPRILFAALGLCALGYAALRWMASDAPLDRASAILFFLAAFGWFWMGRSPKRAGLATLLPVVAYGVEIVRLFWATYRYIHVSAYILGMLGRCATLLFVFALAKGLTQASCSKYRLALCGGWAILLLPAAFMAPLAENAGVETLLSAAEAVLLVVLGVYAVLCLSRELPEDRELRSADLSELNTFIENLPDIEEE